MDSEKAPNLENAIEKNVPTVSGILIGFMVALFAGAGVSDSKFLDAEVCFYPWPWADDCLFTLPLSRRYWVIAVCFLSGAVLHTAILKCIRAQMYNYAESGRNVDNRKIGEWDRKRELVIQSGLNYFNIGVLLVPTSLIFLLPDKAFILGVVGVVVLALLLLISNR